LDEFEGWCSACSSDTFLANFASSLAADDAASGDGGKLGLVAETLEASLAWVAVRGLSAGNGQSFEVFVGWYYHWRSTALASFTILSILALGFWCAWTLFKMNLFLFKVAVTASTVDTDKIRISALIVFSAHEALESLSIWDLLSCSLACTSDTLEIWRTTLVVKSAFVNNDNSIVVVVCDHRGLDTASSLADVSWFATFVAVRCWAAFSLLKHLAFNERRSNAGITLANSSIGAAAGAWTASYSSNGRTRFALLVGITEKSCSLAVIIGLARCVDSTDEFSASLLAGTAQANLASAGAVWVDGAELVGRGKGVHCKHSCWNKDFLHLIIYYKVIVDPGK
jgi:hypothetical protein